jgi:gliding motility-associated lipoprotein GldH
MLRTLSMLFVLFLLVSCGGNIIYEEDKVIANQLWQYGQPLIYQFEIADTTARYDLYLDIDHTTDYPFQNLYTKIYTVYPSGRTAESQINIDLANKLGEWQGKCQGENCQLRVVLQQQTFFTEFGDHQLTLEQYTRRDSLGGIETVRFVVEQVSQ